MAAILAIPLLASLGVLILALNIVQVVSIPFKPLHRAFITSTNERMAAFWYWCLVKSIKILGIEVRFTGLHSIKQERVFLIANHQSMADIPILLTFVAASECLRYLKWFVKDPLKWVPGIGWGMQMLDCIFVKRNWAADKEKIGLTFERLRKSPSGYWIISFVEGTRFTPEKHERSEDYGRRLGLKPLRKLLQPRPKGFLATLEGLEEKIEAIAVCTIRYHSAKPPGLMGFFLFPQGPIELHVESHQVPPPEVREKWLYEIFQKMDQRLVLGQ
jgi:1-acyl-sn-glycerol-3-phosphate acyltransferase